MKISIDQYAQVLYEISQDKSEKDLGIALDRFFTVLQEDGQLRNIANILDKFGKIYNRKNEITEVLVTSREKLNNDVIDQMKDFIKQKYAAKNIKLNESIDENIIGGIRINKEDERIDMTVDRQLQELRKVLVG